MAEIFLVLYNFTPSSLYQYLPRRVTIISVPIASNSCHSSRLLSIAVTLLSGQFVLLTLSPPFGCSSDFSSHGESKPSLGELGPPSSESWLCRLISSPSCCSSMSSDIAGTCLGIPGAQCKWDSDTAASYLQEDEDNSTLQIHSYLHSAAWSGWFWAQNLDMRAAHRSNLFLSDTGPSFDAPCWELELQTELQSVLRGRLQTEGEVPRQLCKVCSVAATFSILNLFTELELGRGATILSLHRRSRRAASSGYVDVVCYFGIISRDIIG